MDVKLVRLAVIFGVTSVILGAFGAHALKAVLTEQQLVSFETGVRYQMFHALFLLFIGATKMLTFRAKKTISVFLILGILFFSGSIYLLATQNLFEVNLKFLGPVTPIGGLLLMTSWVLVGINIGKQKTNN